MCDGIHSQIDSESANSQAKSRKHVSQHVLP
jgi:hypothetical protein